MPDENARTIDWYQKNAVKFISKYPGLGKIQNDIKYFAEHLRGKRVLDVGCGYGRAARELSELGYDVTAIDLADAMLEEARKTAPLAKIIKMDMRKMNFQMPFNGAWVGASLHHIAKTEAWQVLSKLETLLYTGGQLYVSIKAKGSQPKEGDERFFAYYEEDELKKLVKSVGFELDNVETRINGPSYWLVLFATKP